MPVPDIGAMSLEEMIQLRDRMNSLIAEKVAAREAELQAELAALRALATGSPARPSAGAQRKTRGPAAAKYRGPNGETWAGRGAAPKWLTELEAKGRKRDEFAV